MLEFSKSRARRKPKDLTYRPGQDRKKSRTSAKRNRTDSEGLLHLMGVAGSPTKTVVVSHTLPDLSPFKSTRSETLAASQCEASTPQKGPLTSSYITPRHQSRLKASRRVKCDDGDFTIFISEDKAKENLLPIPPVPNEWINNFTHFSTVSSAPKIDIKITKAIIEQVNATSLRRRLDGKNPRLKSQKDTLGIAASTALGNAGISVESGEAHIVHFIPFEFIGDEGQVPDNLGIGLKYSNGAMEMVNRVLREILFHSSDAPEELYLSAIPEWVKGYENIRLLESLTYIVKSSLEENAKSFSITFNMLNRAPVCLTDIEPIAKVLRKKFLKPTELNSVSRTLLFSYMATEENSSKEDDDLFLQSTSHQHKKFRS